ncbi:Nucleotidylyl transferase [Dendrothele bispora CBS 962.96]|uniref:Nucleotidylyl transferase n=1 Tax=Dendrothele bispora (strain CBS 962.96) TaxID=1314807 RepID=A0A4S8MVU8_DENBC|nr:Nucleotidylyl transferase [Dendrothele bispora CBS 962.96]
MSLSSVLTRLRSGSVSPPIELIYSSHHSWPRRTNGQPPAQRPLRIAVLDSSFNPPTVAHLAIANAPRPVDNNDHGDDYDAKLLLLSITNADKQLKSTDATYVQRVEMMCEFAKEVVTRSISPSTNSTSILEEPGNVAVAIINEPTFVGKSRLIQTFLRQRMTDSATTRSSSPCELTFLLGYDTLERFFAPRYYVKDPNSDAMTQMQTALRGFFAEGDSSRIVCAKRNPESYPKASVVPNASTSTDADSLTSTISQLFSALSLPMSECVKMIDIGEDVWTISSSDVRGAIGKGEDRWMSMVSPRVREYIKKEGLYQEKV